jgi:hypothetical protein
MIKVLRKLRIEVTYLSIRKPVYGKPILSIVLNGDRLKPFPLKSRRSQGSSFLTSLVLEF